MFIFPTTAHESLSGAFLETGTFIAVIHQSPDSGRLGTRFALCLTCRCYEFPSLPGLGGYTNPFISGAFIEGKIFLAAVYEVTYDSSVQV